VARCEIHQASLSQFFPEQKQFSDDPFAYLSVSYSMLPSAFAFLTKAVVMFPFGAGRAGKIRVQFNRK
jgi:hypothetical protein